MEKIGKKLRVRVLGKLGVSEKSWKILRVVSKFWGNLGKSGKNGEKFGNVR